VTRVVFRADAGPRIGAGHIVRCLALAVELKSRGARIAFAMRRGSAQATPGFAESGFETIDLPENGDDVVPMIAGSTEPTDIAIVDHYRWDLGSEKALRPRAAKVVVIDDLADRAHDADLLVDATPGRQASDYARLVPDDARVLVGPRYAMLRPEFAAFRKRHVGRPAPSGGDLNVLVSFGGVDSKNLTARTLDAIGMSGLDCRVDVVLGRAAPHIEAIRGIVARLAAGGIGAVLHVQSERMAALMSRADLAVGAAGGTALERCVLGLPSIVVALADNQVGSARALAATGAVAFLGRHEDISARDIADALNALAKDAAARRRMAERAAGICDGMGAGRVADAVIALAA